MMMSSNDKEELRKRGIDYLLKTRSLPKQDNEFSVSELIPLLGLAESSVAPHMQRLVREWIWGTRMAYSPESKRHLRVWWLLNEKEEQAE
jgi:hypothetical protein